MFHLRRRFTLAGGTGTLVTGASILGGTETDVLSFDFTDQSVLIRDTATPANNIHSVGTFVNGVAVGPQAKLTYTAPSLKLCLQSDGYYKYGPHNYANFSSAFDNAEWSKDTGTIVANATTAPDGTTTADKYVSSNSTTHLHRFYQTSTVTQTSCASVS